MKHEQNPPMVIPPRVCPSCGAKGAPDNRRPVRHEWIGTEHTGKGSGSWDGWGFKCYECGLITSTPVVTAAQVIDVEGTRCPFFDSDAGLCVIAPTTLFCKGADAPDCRLVEGCVIVRKKP